MAPTTAPARAAAAPPTTDGAPEASNNASASTNATTTATCAGSSSCEPGVAAKLIYERYLQEQMQLQKKFESDLAAATGVRCPVQDKHGDAARDQPDVLANEHARPQRSRTASRLGALAAGHGRAASEDKANDADADDDDDDDDDEDDSDESSGSTSDGEIPSPASQTSVSNTGGGVTPKSLLQLKLPAGLAVGGGGGSSGGRGADNAGGGVCGGAGGGGGGGSAGVGVCGGGVCGVCGAGVVCSSGGGGCGDGGVCDAGVCGGNDGDGDGGDGGGAAAVPSPQLLLKPACEHAGGAPSQNCRHKPWNRFASVKRKPRHTPAVPSKDSSKDKEGPPQKRVRGSRGEFKRLDELYNKSIHDYYLAETTTSPHGADDIWEEYTFVVRRTFDWRNEYQATLVDIKSEHLTAVLRNVLKDVKTVNTRSDKPVLDPNLLFNYLPDLDQIFRAEKALPEETQNKTKIAHLATLIDYVNTDYAAVASVLYPLLEHCEITFELLWALFLPNTLVYTVCAGSSEPRILKLDCGQHRQDMRRGKWFQLDCHYVDYDGKTFGEAKAVIEIPEFSGSTRIDALSAFPLAYHQDEEQVRTKLMARGRKFGSFRGAHYKFYEGIAFFRKKRSMVRVNVRARIMVDPLTFRKMNPGYCVSPIKRPGSALLAALTGVPGDADSDDDDADADADDDHDHDHDADDAADDDDADDAGVDVVSVGGPPPPSLSKTLSKLLPSGFPGNALAGRPQRVYRMEGNRMQLVQTGASLGKKAPKPAASLDPNEMSEEQLLICSPTVLGFSLGDKLYLEFPVEHIRDIVFNPAAFDRLVLPERQKTIVRALVESHSFKSQKKRSGIDDIIKGKGQGLVAVLHGRPGVGKTLTAEGISEYLQRPLYMISASELGTDARSLEVQLSRILDVAHGWGAVLLLDEADVYLERRSINDLMRNSLVSIFLRLLEYFQGILFLTTNRVETFDEAFQSRIHIALRYQDLDAKARRIIWKTFLDMVAHEEISLAEDGSEAKKSAVAREILSNEDLERLGRRNLNGRQIKNVVRTAQALAISTDVKLSMSHLQMVLEVTEEFEHDLKGTGQLEGMMSYA